MRMLQHMLHKKGLWDFVYGIEKKFLPLDNWQTSVCSWVIPWVVYDVGLLLLSFLKSLNRIIVGFMYIIYKYALVEFMYVVYE